MSEVDIIQTAREEIVVAMLDEHAFRHGVDGSFKTAAKNNARSAIRDGRSVWYAYEVVGKSWIDTKFEGV